jgi:hypothetical protein
MVEALASPAPAAVLNRKRWPSGVMSQFQALEAFYPIPEQRHRLQGRIRAMNAQQIEAEALKLDLEVRARLADRLYLSLDGLTQEEWTRLWAAEAARRDEEMDADPNLGIPAERVFEKLSSRHR